jgi:hypothetical protein
MAQTILLKRSAVAGKVPQLSDVPLGSVALNTADAKLYTRKSLGGVDSIVEIGSSGSGGGGGGVIAESLYLITENYELSANANGTSLGPVSIDAGVTVTVPANATWMVFS